MIPLDIVAVGNISIDVIKIESSGTFKVPGGSAAAVLTAASAYGAKCGAVSKIGEDFPKAWFEDISSRGIDFLGLQKQKHSCRFELTYAKDGELKKFDEIFNVEDFLSMKDVPSSYLDAKHFHLAAAHPKNQEKFLSSTSMKSSFSLTLWPTYNSEYSAKFYELMKKVEILFCNEKEVKMLSSEENIYDAVKKIQKAGPNLIVLTKGAKGSAVYYKKEFHVFPALKSLKVDVTGCGDSFAGGFLAEYLSSKDVLKAGWAGAALASFTMSKMGSWFPREISREKIEERIGRAKSYYEKGAKEKGSLMDFF